MNRKLYWFLGVMLLCSIQTFRLETMENRQLPLSASMPMAIERIVGTYTFTSSGGFSVYVCSRINGFDSGRALFISVGLVLLYFWATYRRVMPVFRDLSYYQQRWY